MKQSPSIIAERLRYITILGFTLHPNYMWTFEDGRTSISHSYLESVPQDEFDKMLNFLEVQSNLDI